MLALNSAHEESGDNSEIECHLPFPEIVHDKINTEEFLTASRDVVRIVDKFGKLFAPVKYDMQGNIDKLTTKYMLNKEKHSTLQDMIMLEKAAGEIIATDALMWLRRALHMILLFFEKIVEDHKQGKATEDLVVFLREAYRDTLERYHGWMAQQLFSLLSRAVPNRTQLLQALANGQTDKNEIVLCNLNTYLAGLRKNIVALNAFYISNNLEDEAVV